MRTIGADFAVDFSCERTLKMATPLQMKVGPTLTSNPKFVSFEKGK